jgi:hypothetical protein
VHPSLNCIDFLCMDSDSSFTRANPRITLATKVYSPTQGFNLLQISPNWFLRNWTLDPLSKVGLQSSSKFDIPVICIIATKRNLTMSVARVRAGRVSEIAPNTCWVSRWVSNLIHVIINQKNQLPSSDP